MIYTIEKADLVSTQLRKFTTAYAHHLVGQYANIDFWLQEVIASQKTIDTYKHRFNQLRDAQKEWVEKHDVREADYCPICRGKCELSDKNLLRPAPPIRTSSKTLDITRRELVNAAYYFLIRCYSVGLLDDHDLKKKCDLIGTSIDPNDLEK
ncbi:hypothetical protein ACFO3O_03875 [Dokdonia ponticola]|uniref:Uncharacterized protein n=1 Tax=Dokdonia ponticola TaxID=2041041 RepID=A0ABV9HSA1_9FLAO